MLKYCQWIFWRRYEKEIANVKNSPISFSKWIRFMGKILSTKEIKFGIGDNEKIENTSTMLEENMKVIEINLVGDTFFI